MVGCIVSLTHVIRFIHFYGYCPTWMYVTDFEVLSLLEDRFMMINWYN